jgi:ATP-dependent protease ClpP protease subunit
VRKVFSRRRLTLMTVAGALSPMTAGAQTKPGTLPGANPAAISAAASAASSLAPSLSQIDKTKPYFLYFQRNIDVPSAKLLRDALVRLADSEVENITLVLNSNGGLVTPTLQLYNLIRSLPVAIKTHGQDLVASSATILMLAGEQRTADKKTQFWLHALSGPLVTTMNTPQFEEQMRLFHDQENIYDQIYRERTKIPDGDLTKFKHETVTYDTNMALRHGIITQIASLKIPPKAKLVFFD